MTIRDNKPINERKLTECLLDGLEPADWYRTLNGRVFFWTSKERLIRLQNARAYRDADHDVLEVRSKPLIDAYRNRITLSSINSGAVIGATPTSRGTATFLPIADYPYDLWIKKRGTAQEAIVELAIDYAVPDIERFVNRVLTMRNGIPTRVLFGGSDR
jgi:hypothetical protein